MQRTLPSNQGREGFVRLWSHASTSMLTPDFSSTVIWSSQMVICLTQRRTSDSLNSVRWAVCCKNINKNIQRGPRDVKKSVYKINCTNKNKLFQNFKQNNPLNYSLHKKISRKVIVIFTVAFSLW